MLHLTLVAIISHSERHPEDATITDVALGNMSDCRFKLRSKRFLDLEWIQQKGDRERRVSCHHAGSDVGDLSTSRRRVCRWRRACQRVAIARCEDTEDGGDGYFGGAGCDYGRRRWRKIIRAYICCIDDETHD